jgi:monoamine oxidase
VPRPERARRGGDQDRPRGAPRHARPRTAHYGNASGRAGFAELPGLAGHPGRPLDPESLDAILRSRLWDDYVFREMSYSWQASLLQPKGGMDQIVEGFRRQPLARRAGTIDALVRYGARVSELAVMGDAATIAYEEGAGARRLEADFCISTIPMPVLAALKSDLPAAYLTAAAALKFMPACKVGWQAKERFWETADQIYGGISWTTDTIDQIWYPSDGFLSARGTLVGAYNRGKRAAAFGDLALEDRLRVAREDGERLHPGFGGMVEHGVAIAWHKMAFQLGAWAYDAEDGALIDVLATPQGTFHAAGDQVTWWSGWQEGAIIAARAAVQAICARCAI